MKAVAGNKTLWLEHTSWWTSPGGIKEHFIRFSTFQYMHSQCRMCIFALTGEDPLEVSSEAWDQPLVPEGPLTEEEKGKVYEWSSKAEFLKKKWESADSSEMTPDDIPTGSEELHLTSDLRPVDGDEGQPLCSWKKEKDPVVLREGSRGPYARLRMAQRRCEELDSDCLGVQAYQVGTHRFWKVGAEMTQSDSVSVGKIPGHEVWLKGACPTPSAESPTDQDCRWPRHNDSFLEGLVEPEGGSFSYLEEAMRRCTALGIRCGGITHNPREFPAVYSLRSGQQLQRSPQGEISFIKPSCAAAKS
ncbi:hypothetical protein FOZ63_028816 [Perkinsus olseni]|uniref:Uncharacterized protein n=1 Tax=Perkinsus olseni TaxID=32597 RepID=A0A7J6S3G6_PEROL|nr:hypothetical protein FOZ63_028816 [Perkinsus olseni]